MLSGSVLVWGVSRKPCLACRARVDGVRDNFQLFLQSKYVFKASGSGRFGQFFLLWVILYFGNLATINIFSIYFDYYVSGILASIPTVFLSFFLNRMIFIKSNKG